MVKLAGGGSGLSFGDSVSGYNAGAGAALTFGGGVPAFDPTAFGYPVSGGGSGLTFGGGSVAPNTNGFGFPIAPAPKINGGNRNPAGGGIGGAFADLVGVFDAFSIAPTPQIGATTVVGAVPVGSGGGTAVNDAQGGFLGTILAGLASIGSTGDAPVQAVPASYSPGSSRGGITPTMIIAGGAALIAAIVLLKK